MKLGVRGKLFLLSVGLIALSLGIGYGYLRPTLDRLLTERIQHDLSVRLALCTSAVEQDEATDGSELHSQAWQRIALRLALLSEARVTLLRADGSLLADSNVLETELQRLENHKNRPEIQQALQRGHGASTRDSATLRQRMMYVARSFETRRGLRGVARLAVSLQEVDRVMARLHVALFFGALLALAMASGMSSIAAHLTARRLRLLTETARRMAQGDLALRASAGSADSDEVDELGRDLDQLADNLSAALRDLRKLGTLRREFVANASHELRTPLSALCSAVETLRGTVVQDPKASQVFLDIIERHAARLRALVDDLLDLARIESPGFRPVLAEVQVSEVFAHVLSFMEGRAAEKKITITTELPSPAPKLITDRRGLEQIVSNYLDNAIKYCPPNSHVALSARLDEEAHALIIEVKDDGPGIAAEHLPRLFERFYRVDTGRSRALGGTGLGLSIVKHMAEAMGGRVGVESRPQHGATFYVSLPMKASARAT